MFSVGACIPNIHTDALDGPIRRKVRGEFLKRHVQLIVRHFVALAQAQWMMSADPEA